MSKARKRGDIRLIDAAAVEAVEVECFYCSGRVVMEWDGPLPRAEHLACPVCGEPLDHGLAALRAFYKLFKPATSRHLSFRVRIPR